MGQYGSPPISLHQAIKEVANWVKENNIEILNVAGNRETTSPGITAFTIDYIINLIKELEDE
jgi:hypothetical protein